MSALLKRLVSLPIALVRFACDLLRAHLVHLTILAIVASAWTTAWSRSLERGRRTFPAIRREDLPERCRAAWDPLLNGHADENVENDEVRERLLEAEADEK